ncbi:MAG: efflux RND transporter periplasmic adaptor subunit [Muribaculaceae bacterium]|nr:efflux RND transporter periplasmic adaptor subunit [Muribaculaceae bacterium]
MKKSYLIGIIAFALSALASCGQRESNKEAPHVAPQDQKDEDEPDGIVMLHSELAERFGVKVDSVYATPMAGSIRCSAVIERGVGSEGVASAPVAGIIRYRVNVGQNIGSGSPVASVNASAVAGGNANLAAKAALDAAEAEVKRLKPLFEEKLVTATEYQAAVAALGQARAAYSPAAAGGTAVSPIAGTVTSLLASDGSYVEVGAPVAAIAADGRLTLRAKTSSDNYSHLRDVRDVRLQTSDGRSILLSTLGGKTGGISSEGGYATITFTFNNDGTLAPGSTVQAWLLSSGVENVISLPLTAITEQQGESFVYKEVLPEHYLKIPVTLGLSDGERIEILSGVEEGDRIVTSGVTTVRLAESSGAVPSGHNHSH